MPFTLRCPHGIKYGLLIAGFTSIVSSAICRADESTENGLDVTMTANIVENTCQISLSDNGEVHLPLVSRGWFYNSDGTTRLQPGDAASGTLFSVNVDGCTGDTDAIKTMTFGFQPQNGVWPAESKQVFINETPSTTGGAENVGIVIFSSSDNRNVVDSDGSSAALVNVTNSSYINSYNFYARYQNTGIVSAGKVTSHVLVNAIYQ